MRVPSVLVSGKADEILMGYFFSSMLTWAISWAASCPSWTRRGLEWSKASIRAPLWHYWNINKISVGFLFPWEQKQETPPPLKLLLHLWLSVGSREYKGRLIWRGPLRAGSLFKFSSWCYLTRILWEDRMMYQLISVCHLFLKIMADKESKDVLPINSVTSQFWREVKLNDIVGSLEVSRPER